MPALAGDGRPHERRDGRAQAVGADHDPGADASWFAALRVLQQDALDPPRGPKFEIRKADPVADRGAGVDGGVHEEAIEQGAPRGEEGGNAVPGPDRDVDHLVLVVEDRPVDARRAGRLDPAEETPPVQLQHAGSHQGVRRQRVAPVGAAIDGKDPHAAPGQQQGRRGARGAGTDDDRVVAFTDAVESRHLLVSFRPRGLRPPCAGASPGGPPAPWRHAPRRR